MLEQQRGAALEAVSQQLPGAVSVGAALRRDGPQSGPGNSSGEAETVGPLRSLSRRKAAPTRAVQT
ncbi:hypothetical protein D3C84_1271510 [compost metagenome]